MVQKLAGVAAFGGIIVGAIVNIASSAGAASASPVDTQFLNNLRSVNYPSLATLIDASPNVVIKAGRSVCTMLDQGYGSQAVEGMLLDRLSLYGDNRTYYAGLVGVYAVQSYCPAHQYDSGFNGQY